MPGRTEQAAFQTRMGGQNLNLGRHVLVADANARGGLF
jgi:hypothetical protein